MGEKILNFLEKGIIKLYKVRSTLLNRNCRHVQPLFPANGIDEIASSSNYIIIVTTRLDFYFKKYVIKCF